MITVCCVLWGDKFSEEYVHVLKSSVERNTTIPHKFVCYSDRIISGVSTVPLRDGLEGWWNKLQLFDGRVDGRIVYFDLDTVITGNIDWLLSYKGKFAGVEDLGAINEHQQYLKGKLQSPIMSWESSTMDWVWHEWQISKEKAMKTYRGDGEYLESTIPVIQRVLLQRMFPQQIKSYKYEVYPSNIGSASIVCFHGRPSIKQSMTETVVTPRQTYEPQMWVGRHWRK